MHRLLTALAVFLLLSAPLSAQSAGTPGVAGPDAGPECTQVVFKATGLPPRTAAKFKFTPAVSGLQFAPNQPKNTVCVCLPAGDYTVEIETVTIGADSEPEWGFGTPKPYKSLPRVGPVPNPFPPPGPGPVPPTPPTPPAPAAQRVAAIVVIENTNQAAAWRGAWLAYQPLWDYIRSDKKRWLVVDSQGRDAGGNAPSDVAPFIKFAADKNTPLPCAFMVAEDGTVLYFGPPPAKPEDGLALLKKTEGK